jgi:hypothetical protein
MSKKAAPWINLTRERPVLDAENRDTINEWCGVVGKREKIKASKKRNIQFPSRAVNWTKQQRDKTLLEKQPDNHQASTSKKRPIARSKPSLQSNAEVLPKSPPKRSSHGFKKKCNSHQNRSTGNFLTNLATPIFKIEEDGTTVLNIHTVPSLLRKDGSMGIRVDPFDCVPGTRDDPRQGEILDYCEPDTSDDSARC